MTSPIPLPSKPGITGASVRSIPEQWDPSWFRAFINNMLKGADVRNATGINGITVSGSIASPYATISLTGGSQPYNIGPDTHTNTPSNVANDEFEYGSVLDTTGARFTGAIPWTKVYSLNSNDSLTISAGNLVHTASNNLQSQFIATQPITNYSSAWSYTLKCAYASLGSNLGPGLYVYNSSRTTGFTWQILSEGAGFAPSGNATMKWYVQYQYGYAFQSNNYLQSLIGSWIADPLNERGFSPYYYLNVAYDGINTYTLSVSLTGVPGTFMNVTTVATSSVIHSPPTVTMGVADTIGITALVDTAYQQSANVFDFFRRTL